MAVSTFPSCPWSAEDTDLNKELFVLYRGATADNDCPLVVDTTTPSCGNLVLVLGLHSC
jgi:hypothetical protein